MKRFPLLLLAIGILGAGFFYTKAKRENQTPNISPTPSMSQEEKYHIHAAFHVYKNDALQDFSSFEYMSVQPCSVDEEVDRAHESLEDWVHLHDFVGDIVHVHRKGITWGSLFENLKYEFAAKPIGFINGTQVEDILDQEIVEYDRALIIEGRGTSLAARLESMPTVDDIKSQESISELCGS